MTGFPPVIPERDCAPPPNPYLGVAPDVSSLPDGHPVPQEGGALPPGPGSFPAPGSYLPASPLLVEPVIPVLSGLESL